MKGKVIVIKRRGPVSGLPRCGRAYKRTGSRQFNSGNLPRKASNATKEVGARGVESGSGRWEEGQRIQRGMGFLVPNILEVTLIMSFVEIFIDLFSSGHMSLSTYDKNKH